MNKLFLIIPVLLFLLIQVPNKAESSSIPPSHYIVTFEDDSGMKIEPPIWIDMLIKYDDKILDNYTTKVFRNPSEVYTSAWDVPNYEEGTTVEIIASKEGYLQSQPHIYTITKDSPFTGIVFEHVFQLASKHMPLKTAPKQIPYTININNTHYQIFTQTDQELQKIYYDEEFNGIILHVIGDDYYGNNVNLIIPKEMMNGRFDMFNFKINAWHPEIIDGELGQITGHIVTESENSTNLTVYFGKGENHLGITATHVVPEFSTSQIIIVLGLIIVIILGIIFTKRKTALQVPDTT